MTSFVISMALFTQVLFFGLLLVFSLYGVFLAYHWYTFGSDNQTSTIALAVYLLGGAILFLTLSGSMGFIA